MQFPRTLPALLLLLLPAPVLAQAIPTDSAITLPELTVAATRSPTTLAAHGGAVTVVDGEAARRLRLATGLDELLAFVPGVLAANRWNWSLDQRLAIRGFGARANFGVRGVRVLLDGIPQTLPDGQSQLTNLDLADLARVEVLRGAASSLHGNAGGGVVAFTSRAAPPGQGLALEAGSEAGAFGLARYHGRAAWGGDRVGASLTVSRLASDGFRDWSAAEQRRVTGALDARVGDATRLLVRAAWADDPRARNPGALTLAEAAATPSAAAPNNLRRGADKAVTQGQLALGVDHAEGAWRVEARTWLLHRDLANPIAAPAPPPTTPEEGLWIGIGRRGGGARATVSRRLGTGGQLTAGVDAQQVRDDRRNRRHLVGAPFGEALVDQRETTAELGVFAQAVLPLGGAWAIRGGLRHDATRFEVADRLAPANGGTRSLGATTTHLGFVRAGDRTTAWISAATSFETPTTTELANRPDGTTGLNRDLEAQRATSVEAGVRTQGGWGSLDAAAFVIETRDAIVPYEEVGGRSYFRNAGAQRTVGAEAALTIALGGALQGLATWTVTQATFTEYVALAGAGVQRYDGNDVPGIPRHAVRLGVRGVIGPLLVDADHGILASQAANDANTLRVPGNGAGITSLRVASRLVVGQSVLEPFVAVQNLWDRHAIGSVVVNGGFGRVAEPAPGRFVTLGLRAGWRAER